MIQKESRLDVADNSGAKVAMVIGTKGMSTARGRFTRIAVGVGDRVTCTVKNGLGVNSAQYRMTEARKDAEYTGHTASTIPISDNGMYGFLFLVGIAGAAGYVHTYPDTLDQLGFKDTTIPTI